MFDAARSRRKSVILLVVLGSAWPLSHARAGVLNLDPFVTVGEFYTDNLLLAPPGEPREDDFITEIEPGLRLDYAAPRLTANVDYRLQGLVYADHSDMNHAYSQLNANATLEAIEDWFFINGRTIYDHQVIDPERTGGRNNLFGGTNRTGLSATTISPYLQHDFGSVGVATLRYGYGRVYYSSDIPDITSNTYSFLLARQPQYGDLTYDLFYLDQEINPDRGRDLSFKQARLGLQYHVSARTALVANVGKENQFLPNGAIDELGSTFWNAGVRWQAEKDRLEILYGHRFFGASYQFSWHHDGADIHTDVSYLEEPTNYNRLLLGRQPTTAIESPYFSYAELPSLRNRRVFVLKRAALNVAFDLSDSQIRVRLYDEHRNYVELAENDHVQGGRIAWEFAMGTRDSLVPSYSYRRYEFRDGQINYYYRSQIAWSHKLGRTLSMRVAARNEKRNTIRGQGYRVNTILLEVTKHF
ncbi:MAG TPA: TIGR03016 family PEP-CTERM system-associated outer membrane protein [Gammaproteobacteria bacterium]|nr:TIGR03016 family PEP-CTERM system-associated outer membrane protein [Gammaproteobacteria bacterium]